MITPLVVIIAIVVVFFGVIACLCAWIRWRHKKTQNRRRPPRRKFQRYETALTRLAVFNEHRARLQDFFDSG